MNEKGCLYNFQHMVSPLEYNKHIYSCWKNYRKDESSIYHSLAKSLSICWANPAHHVKDLVQHYKSCLEYQNMKLPTHLLNGSQVAKFDVNNSTDSKWIGSYRRGNYFKWIATLPLLK